tara:strand:- start:2042 stop:2461 length:420 start_codon:yes stop_codon:yes gene_type:complete
MPAYVIAPAFPLEIEEETGSYTTYGVTDLTKVIDQNLKMTLLTSPGERLFDSNFGVGLRKYLFELDSTILDGTVRLPPLRENILSQISTYLPYLTVQNLQINVSSDSNSLAIVLKYSVNDNTASSIFELTINEVNSSTL